MMRAFGLIGRKLGHSFSKGYFSKKFEAEGIANCSYDLFELASIRELPALIAGKPHLRGLNVTIPYKQEVLPYLQELDDSARKVGAVNVISISPSGKLTGFNSDYYGFKSSIEQWLPRGFTGDALVLGTGGASLAVIAALRDLGIAFKLVSRKASAGCIDYASVREEGLLASHTLIVNTTPLGMHPHHDKAPDIDYSAFSTEHYVYDLIYNPETTKLMAQAAQRGAHVLNGLQMLHLQAEKSWEIWNGEA